MKKIKKILLLIFCFLLFINSEGQTKQTADYFLTKVKEASYYDSLRLFSAVNEALKTIPSALEEEANAKCDIYLGNHFFYSRDFKLAGDYFTKAHERANKFKLKKVETLSEIRLSFLKFELGNEGEAEQELNTLLLKTKKESDFENTAEILNLIGIIQEKKNNLKEATRLYIEGLTVSEVNNLNYYNAVFRNNLGLLKLYSGQFKEAQDDFNKGLILAEKENNARLASHLQMNICLTYVYSGKSNIAFNLFNKVIQYSKINNLPQELTSSYINISSAFVSSGDYIKAQNYLDSAIFILEKQNLYMELTKAYLGKADVFITLNKFNEAEIILNKAVNLTKKTRNLQDVAQYYYMAYLLTYKKKDYKSAVENYMRFSKLNDSLHNQLNSKVIAELQLSNSIRKKESELEKERNKTLNLEKINQEEKYLKWFIAGTALILLISIVGISSYLYNKKVNEKQHQFSRQLINNIEAERKRISRDLHDDIGQSLSMVRSKINNENGIVREEIGRIIEQTRQISKNLYPSQLEKIGLLRLIASLAENIQHSSGIVCSFDIHSAVDQLPLITQTHLFRIFQECSNNTLKHSGAKALQISVEIKKENFIFTYLDNGTGLNVQKNNSGIGLISIRERAKIINATVQIDENIKGFKLVLFFKKPVLQNETVNS